MLDGNKASQWVTLSMDATVQDTVNKLVADLNLPPEEDGEAIHYQLLRQRQLLDSIATLYSVGVQEGDILQLIGINAKATLGLNVGRAMAGNLLNRLGSKSSNELLPIVALLTDKTGRLRLPLQHTRAIIGRADPNLGYTPDTLDADLTEIDPDRTVSRPHALIVYGEEGFTIRDLYSQHGLFLNGELLPPNKAHTLHDGDILTFGKVELWFFCEV